MVHDLNILKNSLEGEVLGDAFDRGRYATDASIYQMMPHGVIVPKSIEDIIATIDYARSREMAILPRGGGTSQCGQTVNHALVLDNTKYLNRLLELDVEGRRCVVEPGIVLDELNRQLKPHGLWFPVDVSTSSRATIGGMAGNNSCGGRSIRYGIMRDNVTAIDAVLADGRLARFGALDGDISGLDDILPVLLRLGAENAGHIRDHFPDLLRRVGGYNIDALIPDAMSMRPGCKKGDGINLAHLLVGSEGTLAYSSAIELKLWPLPGRKIMGICHFPSFYQAMDAAQHLVKLDPVAVELIDDTMISLARSIPLFQDTVREFVRGEPAALLVVEFAEDDDQENHRRMGELEALMGDLGFAWDKDKDGRGGVVVLKDASAQARITEMRKSGLNIMMSMKDEAKPVSFVEDCSVGLDNLAEYTAGLTSIFEKYGTKGTWYAHASVGCLHVRPVLNMKNADDVATMRAIAGEAFALVRRFRGSHSGEHGDGIVRSEFHEEMFGRVMTSLFRDIKTLFDPSGVFNPGKIVDAPRMDDRSLFRFAPGYHVKDFPTQLDWSAWPGAAGGFQGAVEMCNNNGACRKLEGGVMCPSFRVTRDERDSTRGRANSLRLALSGQLGTDALVSDAMAETMSLCVSCKACRRECPTGVDMARMKVEITALNARNKGFSLRDHLIGHLPRFAPWASRLAPVFNLRDRLPGLAFLSEKLAGFSARRPLPRWRRDIFRNEEIAAGPDGKKPVILFADTFNRYFEPENLRDAVRVLNAAGYQVFAPSPSAFPGRSLCCGRTYLSVGMVDKAREEATRLIETFAPYAAAGIPVVGLEPSCLLALKDEVPSLVPGEASSAVAGAAVTFEELLANDAPDLPLKPLEATALLHGHCHQKAFNVMRPVEEILRRIRGLSVETIETSCCGMAGAFGYGAESYDISTAMAEEKLLPRIRQAPEKTILLADGTSCRCQISDGSGRKAIHVARLLAQQLNT